MIIKDFSSLIGIPYEEMNCWQFCRAFYKQVFSLEIKHYFDEMPESRTSRKELIYSNVGDFIKVDKPQFGDLALIKILGIESHIGIYINDRQFAHSSHKTGSVVDNLKRWENHITGYYRHQVRG